MSQGELCLVKEQVQKLIFKHKLELNSYCHIPVTYDESVKKDFYVNIFHFLFLQ